MEALVELLQALEQDNPFMAETKVKVVLEKLTYGEIDRRDFKLLIDVADTIRRARAG